MTDAFAYDVLHYPSQVHPQMHPARLAAIARLHGIPAASPADCRLLEVGCGDGLQLIALAMAYPQGRFVGVDMSQAAIARGEAMRKRLDLHNLQLVAADLLAWQPDPAGYDYIVAHGFYSWVPESVRERLLVLCAATLMPAGIAYVSYNALPGGHLRRMLWEMLKHHARDADGPAMQIGRAQEMLAWLAQDVLSGRESYAHSLRIEARDLLERTDTAVMFHDDLAAINTPFSFADFIAAAQSHGLTFLAEADYFESEDHALADDAARARLAAMAGDDRLAREQYLDFLKGRRFRQTLLCRNDAPLRAEPDPMAALDLQVVADMHAETEDGQPISLAPGVAVRFASSDGAALVTDHPLAKAALLALTAAFPAALDTRALLETARQRCESHDDADADAALLAHTLVTGFRMGLLLLLCDGPTFAAAPGEHPQASALVRLQLEAGLDLVTSLRPSMVRLDSRLALELLRLLDGRRDRTTILDDLAVRMAALPVPDDAGGETFRDIGWWRQQLATTLDDGLRQTARMGLLVT